MLCYKQKKKTMGMNKITARCLIIDWIRVKDTQGQRKQ